MELFDLRKKIDAIDGELLELFKKRMRVSKKAAEYKKENNLPVYDAVREQEIQKRASEKAGELAPYAQAFFSNILRLSAAYQFSLSGKYGLVGENLSYSYSKFIHDRLSAYDYELISLDKGGFDRFITSRGFLGLNITNPYKQAVIPYCDEITNIASETNCVNTVYKKCGRLIGTNTDCDGFMYMLGRSGISLEGKKVLILGAGATSRTIKHCASLSGAAETVTAGRGHDFSKSRGAEIIINATPVGTFPENGGKIIDLSDFPECKGVLDVVYNPLRTELLLRAKEYGIPHSNGLPMLVAQATKAAELFTGTNYSDNNEKLLDMLNASVQNIVLIGMPGAGKTTAGRQTAEKAGMKFVDLDEAVERGAGMSIPDIFSKYGEDYFRDLESRAAKEYGKKSGFVIAAGGGIVTRKENMDALSQNAVVIFLDRETEKLETKGRPLSKDINTLKKMYEERLPLYEKYCDYILRPHSSFKIE